MRVIYQTLQFILATDLGLYQFCFLLANRDISNSLAHQCEMLKLLCATGKANKDLWIIWNTFENLKVRCHVFWKSCECDDSRRKSSRIFKLLGGWGIAVAVTSVFLFLCSHADYVRVKPLTRDRLFSYQISKCVIFFPKWLSIWVCVVTFTWACQ